MNSMSPINLSNVNTCAVVDAEMWLYVDRVPTNAELNFECKSEKPGVKTLNTTVGHLSRLQQVTT